MKPTEFRKKRLAAGDVFTGIKTKDPNRRKMIESQRHNMFMDMQGSEPAVAAGLPARPNPCEWVDKFVKTHGKEHTEAKLKETLKTLENTDAFNDPLMKPYFTSESHKKNLTFYRNANGYFKNKYLK